MGLDGKWAYTPKAPRKRALWCAVLGVAGKWCQGRAWLSNMLRTGTTVTHDLPSLEQLMPDA